MRSASNGCAVNGAGDGRLTHYIYPTGQCQESGRDQAHTQLGLAHLGDASEIAWHQGLDLYAYAGNRLLAGFEYTAKYNLGEEPPFEPDLDRSGKYAHMVISPRGQFRPVFEQIYNHYVNRREITAPFTQKAAEKIRPEGAALGADHPGFGTLLYSRPQGSDDDAVPVMPPGAVIAQPVDSGIQLTWIATRAAGSYTVKRATSRDGPYTIIVTNLRNAEFTDKKVKAGALYYYVVSAFHADSVETSVAAGLPSPWLQSGPGGVTFDGAGFTLEGADQFQIAYCPIAGDRVLTARFVPQVSAQSSKMGVMMRAGLAADAPQIALLLTPSVSGSDRERPTWQTNMIANGEAKASQNLGAPYVTWGRLMMPYWLRLERSANRFTGSISADGENWTKVAETTVSLPSRLFAGLAASSSLAKLTTTVVFDHVSVGTK
jgi:hypothetical protein